MTQEEENMVVVMKEGGIKAVVNLIAMREETEIRKTKSIDRVLETTRVQVKAPLTILMNMAKNTATIIVQILTQIHKKIQKNS